MVSQTFGLEYDLDIFNIVAVAHAVRLVGLETVGKPQADAVLLGFVLLQGGAMENKSCESILSTAAREKRPPESSRVMRIELNVQRLSSD